MIYYCYLAAGSGRRFGSNKLIAPFSGAPLWTYGYAVLKNVQKELGGIVRVVTRTPEIAAAVGSDAVLSPESENGKSFSVKNAVRSLGEILPTDKILFLTADQPYIREASVRALLSVPLVCNKDEKGPLAAAVYDGLNLGSPVVFSGCLAFELLALTGDNGGKAVLMKHPAGIVKVPVPARELFDVDTRENLENPS